MTVHYKLDKNKG